jgi:hypothetical protein
MSLTLTLDVWDPTGTNNPEVTVTNRNTGAAVTDATVTVTIRRDDGTDAGAALAGALASPLSLTHQGSGVYSVAVTQAQSAAAGITLAAGGRLLLDYRAVASGLPEQAEPIRQVCRVGRKRDAT